MIPLVDLQAQYASIKNEIDAAVLEVLASGQFALGPEVAAFEEEFAAFCSAKHGIAVNSGTSALHLALLAAGVGPGDEGVTVPFTFIATVAAIRYTGATPVFVDICEDTFNINSARIPDAIEYANMLFVVAAGNYSSNNDNQPFYPASFDSENIISVASWGTDLFDFSN